MEDAPTGTRLRVLPDRSLLAVRSRSSVGPVTFAADGLDGEVRALLVDGIVDTSAPVAAWVEVDLTRLRCGNSVYDAELQRRLNVRRHPRARVELTDVRHLDAINRYAVAGTIQLAGSIQPAEGTVQLTAQEDGTVVVTGEHLLDIREFGIPSPTALMLRIFPDVTVVLELHAGPVADG